MLQRLHMQREETSNSKKGHIVEKAQEMSSDTGIHIQQCVHVYTQHGECWIAETHPHHTACITWWLHYLIPMPVLQRTFV